MRKIFRKTGCGLTKNNTFLVARAKKQQKGISQGPVNVQSVKVFRNAYVNIYLKVYKKSIVQKNDNASHLY